MDKASYAILEAEIHQHYSIIQRIYETIADRKTKDTPEGIDSLAYHVHNLYGAYEELFESVVRFFENQIESVRYHKNLLFRMKMGISGIRPALLSEPTYLLLDEMRRFRHFFPTSLWCRAK
ncbi:MAG: ribonuclease toxin HepT-like protein [bacterium]